MLQSNLNLFNTIQEQDEKKNKLLDPFRLQTPAKVKPFVPPPSKKNLGVQLVAAARRKASANESKVAATPKKKMVYSTKKLMFMCIVCVVVY